MSDDAEVVLGLGVVGLQPQRRAIVRLGLGGLCLAASATPQLLWASPRSDRGGAPRRTRASASRVCAADSRARSRGCTCAST